MVDGWTGVDGLEARTGDFDFQTYIIVVMGALSSLTATFGGLWMLNIDDDGRRMDGPGQKLDLELLAHLEGWVGGCYIAVLQTVSVLSI